MEIFLPGSKEEKLFLGFLKDIAPYKDFAVIIGGWLPYLYVKYLWKIKKDVHIIKTNDIDVALHECFQKQTISIREAFEQTGHYSKERVYDLEDHPFNFFLGDTSDDESMRIDFITHDLANPADIEKNLTGKGVNIINLETIEIMLKRENWIELNIGSTKKRITVPVISPATYFFIKGITFTDRNQKENNYKFAKDMWSMFFMLENVPTLQKNNFIKDILDFRNKESSYFEVFKNNIHEYFNALDSRGPKHIAILFSDIPSSLMIQRIYNKFQELITPLSKISI